jgi:hypothetical protein
MFFWHAVVFDVVFYSFFVVLVPPSWVLLLDKDVNDREPVFYLLEQIDVVLVHVPIVGVCCVVARLWW